MSARTLPIRPRRLRRVTALVVFVAILVGVGVGWAVDAKADALSFIQSLNNHGMSVYDTTTALTWGAAICEALNTTNGADVVANFYRVTNSDIPDMYTAGVWVTVAVEELCPWHDHRGVAA
jgi:hypothetical protein